MYITKKVYDKTVDIRCKNNFMNKKQSQSNKCFLEIIAFDVCSVDTKDLMTATGSKVL